MLNYAVENNEDLNQSLTRDIIKTLLYFDIFSYPLTKKEMLFFNPSACSSAHRLDAVLSALVESRLIYQVEDFYLLRDAPSLITRRKAGNALASRKLRIARRISGFISWFPFVRAVMLSGSLSKGYMDDESDIDFFIVTAPGKLWIARTMLVLFKRLFLFNSHKYFCVNYFIDTENLEIEEKNLFTAMESVTLIPTFGEEYYHNFLAANRWILDFFPNSSPALTSDINKEHNPLKKFMEGLFNNRIGRRLDRYFMQITLKRWKLEFGQQFSKEDFELAFKTKKYASKNHPRFYQKKVLDTYREKIACFERNFKINLNPGLL